MKPLTLGLVAAMKPLTLGLVAASLVACGGAGKKSSQGGAVLAKHIELSWYTEPAGDSQSSKVNVFMTTTDEIGTRTNVPLGTYDGTCGEIGPKSEFGAITVFQCSGESGGTQLQASLERKGGELLIMIATFEKGGEIDPMARKELTRISYPIGAKVTVAR